MAAATLSHRYITDRFLPDKAIDLVDEACARAFGPRSTRCRPELDELTRRVIRLEIEEAALARRPTRPAASGSRRCARSWPTCAQSPTRCVPSGRPSARRSAGCRRCASELEQLRHEIEEAERDYDLNRAAELRHGRLPELERRLAGRGGAARADSRASSACCARRSPRRRSPRSSPAGPASRSPGYGGRAREAAPPRRGPARARRRPGRGRAAGGRRGHPRPRGHQGPAAADRLVHLPRPDRRRQDRARQRARRGAVRLRGQHGPPRHVRVPGAAHGQPAGRRPARLRRLRGGRPAHRGGAAQAVLGGALRRDREGAPGRLQHPAPGAGRRPPDRRPGPHGRLPQHRHHHDLQHRVRVPARGRRPPTARSRRRRRGARVGASCARTSGPSSSTASTTSCCSAPDARPDRAHRRPADRVGSAAPRRAAARARADGARPHLVARNGYDPVYGARPLRRYIQREVETRIARALLSGEIGPGSAVVVDAEDDQVVVHFKGADGADRAPDTERAGAVA